MGQGQTKTKMLPKDKVKEIQQVVNFTEDEINEWYAEFSKRSKKVRGEGAGRYISEEEFVKVYNSVYTTGDGEQFGKHVFRTFDLNGDGKVDFQEFLIGMSMSGSTDPKALMSWAFKVYDVDSTGYIDMPEMIEIIKSVFRLLGPEMLHVNGVDKTPESLAVEIFAQLDKNGDQKISWQEFYDGATHNPIVIRLLQCQPLGNDPEQEEEEDSAD